MRVDNVGKGLYFERLDSGDIRIIKNENNTISASTEWSFVVPKDVWIDLIMRMSKDGETVGNGMIARNFHEGNIHSIALLEDKYKQVVGVDLKPLEELLEEHF